MVKYLAIDGTQFAKLYNLKLQKFSSTDPIDLKSSTDWAYHYVFRYCEFGGCSSTVALNRSLLAPENPLKKES